MKTLVILFILSSTVLISGCESTYYSAMEKVGLHKRDILINRLEDAQEAQQDGQAQFKDALEQFRSVVNFDGGDLEAIYNSLSDELEDSESAAEEIRSRIDDVDSVANALFDEWKDELGQYTSSSLRRDSERKLKETQRRYNQLFSAMRNAEKTIDPVLNTLRDNTLYLKHNLNARAISSLKGEFNNVNTNVTNLLSAMEKAIKESDSFIKQLKDG